MGGTLYRPLIDRMAIRYGLDPTLVEAVVLTESAGHTDAFRHEPAFYRRYIQGKPEWAGWVPRRVASSYGLMQVLFTTALLNGWEGEPEELFIPTVGLNAGCARLRYLLDWSHRLGPEVTPDLRQRAALAAYNGGQRGNAPTEATLRNAAYVKRVMMQRGKLSARA